MNFKKNPQTQDQIKNGRLHSRSIEHKSISLSFSNAEFFNRQQLYDELYNSNRFQIQSSNCLRTEQRSKQSKFKEVVESAQTKFIASPINHRKNITNLQQRAISEIVEQLRKQKRENNAKLKNTDNNSKKQNQLNLNFILVIAISLICYLVVLYEMIKPLSPNSK
ncbi:unnamed protein product [Paramecium octaurelia]|uniref:Transmembrane protein n=1 Tax=Paramecium octaurelia TaxID=43137 RepID=A0A8S1W8P9_PAROT|nr:unnamed protein product [Paramecium octaurelia]